MSAVHTRPAPTLTDLRRSAIRFRVAGVSFQPGYPGNLLALQAPAEAALAAGEGLPVVLQRDPHNAYDRNAVQVHIPAVGMVGHLPARLAERAAPKMDAGQRFAGEVVGVAVDPLHPDRPGLEVRVWRQQDDGAQP